MTRLRLTVGGLIGPTQSWSNTLEFSLSAPVSSQLLLQTLVGNIRTTLSGDANFKAGLCGDSSLVSVKALQYNTNAPPATLVAEATGTAVNGTTTSLHAPQVCVVASLRTSAAGRSGRGRTFVPYRGAAISSLGVVSSAGQAIIAAYVNAISTAVFSALAMQSIASAWIVYSPKTGNMLPLSAINVGTQCDTIRHRNNNRDEAYTAFVPAHAVITVDNDEDEEALGAVQNTPIPADLFLKPIQGPPAGFVNALIDVVRAP